MENEYDLPEVLASIFLSDNDDLSGITLDDFYDFMGIPQNNPDEEYYPRNDYASAVLHNQAQTLYSNAR